MTSSVPRLPVLGWRSLRLRRSQSYPASVLARGQPVFVSSGRAAIYHALRSLAVGPGDRILVPTYHCPTMVAPIARLGAEPLFYAIDRTAGADLGWLNEIDLRGVKAMIAVHFFGIPQALGRVQAFCRERGIALIEDCAHAFFGRCGATPVGASGDFVIASLPKFFPSTEGGCLFVTAQAGRGVSLMQPGMLAELRAVFDVLELGVQHGRLGVLGSALNAVLSVKRRLRRSRDGAASTRLQLDAGDPAAWLDEAALERSALRVSRLLVAYTHAERLIARRRANYERWRTALENVEGAQPLFPDLPEGAVPYVFPLKVQQADGVYQKLRARGVPVFRWDIAWPGVPRLEGDHGREWLTDVFQLGCHQELSESDVLGLAEIVRTALVRH
ncbi:MAG: DegT/DnrJ/EryC1/StrS family aminotransferase [Sutterellaceae bacterium]|nr:DegT/DnrJ/EryC1/StrS family aminotransferase [Burkholderiaceae bacterium]MDW8429185.1 DegT/DnrJ/EryC1/StrS family aminotransferase [Sutterellaceae bacterium]